MNIVLWIIQGLLALAFLMAGFMKAFTPLANLEKRMAWVKATPAPLVRFIGVAEILGAIGLIIPAITGIASWLTVAAAGSLAVVMLSAAGLHASRHENSSIGMNVILLVLALLILVGRLTFAPAYF
jgi:putative oxidoreductase